MKYFRPQSDQIVIESDEEAIVRAACSAPRKSFPRYGTIPRLTNAMVYVLGGRTKY